MYDATFIQSLSQPIRNKLQLFDEHLKENSLVDHQDAISGLTVLDPNAYVFIPVVVHVIRRTQLENISDAQICSQITVLNEDFARLNADRVNTPAAFGSSASNPRIQFYLATVDPSGNSTSGITRTTTTATSFTDDDNVKFTNLGGEDGWPPDKYLNIWVCNIPSYLGYSTFPEEVDYSPEKDGVVIHYRAFGKGLSNLLSDFNLGRTATHEVGHWLGLRHIWGDDEKTNKKCNGTDDVMDTPNQGVQTYHVPSFPLTDCMHFRIPGHYVNELYGLFG